MIFYKKATRRPGLEYEESVEEALCFGWVDSRKKRLDDERYALMFTPRKPESPWSRSNKERVEKLIGRGLMTPAGLARIEEAKRNGAWTVYDPIENLVVPDDLAAALDAETGSLQNFEGFSVSVRKSILWWIASARRPETRARRIAKAAAAAAANRSPL